MAQKKAIELRGKLVWPYCVDGNRHTVGDRSPAKQMFSYSVTYHLLGIYCILGAGVHLH